jgi:hypothetical protein
MDLDEEKRVALYEMSRAFKWESVAAFAVQELGCDAPSRNGFYRFIGEMSRQISHKKSIRIIKLCQAVNDRYRLTTNH